MVKRSLSPKWLLRHEHTRRRAEKSYPICVRKLDFAKSLLSFQKSQLPAREDMTLTDSQSATCQLEISAKLHFEREEMLYIVGEQVRHLAKREVLSVAIFSQVC